MAATRKKSRKKKPKQKSRRVLLAEWSKDVRNRDNNQCVVCGQAVYVNAHHILCKHKYSAFKFERDNGVSLCPRHHKFTKESAHVNAIWFSEWLRVNKPELWNKALERIKGNE